MQYKYVLNLSSEGDSFSCRAYYDDNLCQYLNQHVKIDRSPSTLNDVPLELEVIDNKAFCYFGDEATAAYQLPDGIVPKIITSALSCTNRNEVIDFLNQYSLVDDYLISDPVPNSNSTNYIFFKHWNFAERNTDVQGEHYPVKGALHDEAPAKMLQFVKSRESFFQNNYKAGQDYANTAWYNPVWLLVLIDYYITQLMNLICFTPTQYCDDFDTGYYSVVSTPV